MMDIVMFDRWAGKTAEVIANGDEIESQANGEIKGCENDAEIHRYKNADVGCVGDKAKRMYG